MAEYKPGFSSAHQPARRRADGGQYSQGTTLRRRQVGDVDPVGKANFEAEMKKAAQPMRKPAAVAPPPPVEQPETSFRSKTGQLRTRKERIDYEVDKAENG